MPSKSAKQRRFMAAAANNPDFAKRAGIDQSVAKEYHKADYPVKKFIGGAIQGAIAKAIAAQQPGAMKPGIVGGRQWIAPVRPQPQPKDLSRMRVDPQTLEQIRSRYVAPSGSVRTGMAPGRQFIAGRAGPGALGRLRGRTGPGAGARPPVRGARSRGRPDYRGLPGRRVNGALATAQRRSRHMPDQVSRIRRGIGQARGALGRMGINRFQTGGKVGRMKALVGSLADVPLRAELREVADNELQHMRANIMDQLRQGVKAEDLASDYGAIMAEINRRAESKPRTKGIEWKDVPDMARFLDERKAQRLARERGED